MKNISLTLVLGSIILTLFINNRTVQTRCILEKVNEEKHVECKDLNATDFPSNFETDIKSVVLLSSTLETVSSKSIMQYTKLETLRILYSWIKLALDETFLSSFKSLKILVIELSSVPTRFINKLPDSLENITLVNMKLTDLNLTNPNLLKLKYLDLTLNYLTTFPNLNKSYPLEYIILDNNPQVIVSMEDIVPFCALKYLGVNALAAKKFASEEKDAICRCLRLQWFVRNETIETNFDKNQCSNVEVKDCSLKLDEESLKIRAKCPPKPAQHLTEQSNLWYYIVSGIVIASLVAVVATMVAVNKWLKNSRAQTDSSEYEDATDGEAEYIPEGEEEEY